MVGTTLAIEREMEDARGIRNASAGGNRKEDQPSSSLGKRQRTYVPRASQVQGQPKPMTCFYYHHLGHMKRDCHKGIDPRVLGQCNPSYQWDRRRLSLFLLTRMRARGASISPRVLHRRLRLHI